MLELVFAGDTTSYVSSYMFKRLLELAKRRKDFRIAALVTKKHNGMIYVLGQQKLGYYILRYIVTNLFNGFKYKWNYQGDIEQMAKKNNIPIQHDFRGLKGSLLSVAYPYRIKVAQFDYAVNYHNSLLPEFGGVQSTSFAVYFKSKYAGYTFHKMVEDFDSGNILLQKRIPINDKLQNNPNYYDLVNLDFMGTEIASIDLDKVINLIKCQFDGMAQEGEKSYYGWNEWHDFLKSPIDVQRKIACFGFLWRDYDYKEVYVTGINNKGDITRICYLPVWLYKIVSKLLKV